MKKSLALLAVLLIGGCDDDSKSKPGARDGGDAGDTGTLIDGSLDGMAGRDTSVDATMALDGPDVGGTDAGDAGVTDTADDGAPDAGQTSDAMAAVDSHRGAPNSWSTLPGGFVAVIQPVAGVLGSNIVVAGGRTSASLAGTTSRDTLYFAIPAADQIRIVVNMGMPLATPRWGAAFTVAAGRLWAIGGSGSIGFSCLASVESLGSATEAWMPGPALPQPRCAATAVALGQYVYVIGGTTLPVPRRVVMPAAMATCRLDTANLPAGWDCTSFVGGNDVAPWSFNATGASTGSLALIAGGRDATMALAAVNQVGQNGGNPDFAAAMALPMALNLPAIVSANGSFYVYGGSTAVAPGGPGSSHFWRTSATAPAAWMPVTAMLGTPWARTGHVMVAARCAGCTSDRLYVIGGHNDGLPAPLVDEYTE